MLYPSGKFGTVEIATFLILQLLFNIVIIFGVDSSLYFLNLYMFLARCVH